MSEPIPEMVERVARAAATAYLGRPADPAYVFGAATGGHVFVEVARAVIEAMRDPGEDALDAVGYGRGSVWRDDFLREYRRLIDAALHRRR
jgi:surfactin synthase thioesterase subunit